MNKKISLVLDGVSYTVDEFFKSMVFQYIMDDESLDRDERDVLLLIFRKTLHFNKWSDRLGIYFMSTSIGIGQVKTRKAIKQLEDKHLISVERSKGGRVANNKKFHLFEIHGDFVSTVFGAWKLIKENQGFDIDDE